MTFLTTSMVYGRSSKEPDSNPNPLHDGIGIPKATSESSVVNGSGKPIVSGQVASDSIKSPSTKDERNDVVFSTKLV